MNLKAAEQFGEVTVIAPFSPSVLKHIFIIWRVLGGRGFFFVYIPSNFLLMVIWKNPVGRIWGRLQKYHEVLSPLDCCKRQKGQKNISQEDCTRWECWRWWKATEVISQVGMLRCTNPNKHGTLLESIFQQITFQGEPKIPLNWKYLTVLGFWLLK